MLVAIMNICHGGKLVRIQSRGSSRFVVEKSWPAYSKAAKRSEHDLLAQAGRGQKAGAPMSTTKPIYTVPNPRISRMINCRFWIMTPFLVSNWCRWWVLPLLQPPASRWRKRGNGHQFFIDHVNHISDTKLFFSFLDSAVSGHLLLPGGRFDHPDWCHQLW